MCIVLIWFVNRMVLFIHSFLLQPPTTWTEHSPTNNTSKKWKEKWVQGTTSSINSQIHHGVPILPPCELLPLHSAIQLQNMPVLCGEDHPMQRKLTPPLMTAADASLVPATYECWQSICPGWYRPTWRSQIGSQQDWTQEASWWHSPCATCYNANIMGGTTFYPNLVYCSHMICK